MKVSGPIILFDLDGTLTDSAPGITRSVAFALEEHGMTGYKEEDLVCFLGPPLREEFIRFTGLEGEIIESLINKFRERFRPIGIFENTVYVGIPEILKYLKEQGITLGVASSKPEPFVRQILEHFELDQYFTEMAGSCIDETKTKKSEVLEMVLERFGRLDDRKGILLVGDREHDVMGAHEMGLSCAGVLYGYGSREELETAGADLILNDVSDMKQLAEYVRNM